MFHIIASTKLYNAALTQTHAPRVCLIFFRASQILAMPIAIIFRFALTEKYHKWQNSFFMAAIEGKSAENIAAFRKCLKFVFIWLRICFIFIKSLRRAILFYVYSINLPFIFSVDTFVGAVLSFSLILAYDAETTLKSIQSYLAYAKQTQGHLEKSICNRKHSPDSLCPNHIRREEGLKIHLYRNEFYLRAKEKLHYTLPCELYVIIIFWLENISYY